MKTISVPAQATELNTFLQSARDEDVFVRTADGSEYCCRQWTISSWK